MNPKLFLCFALTVFPIPGCAEVTDMGARQTVAVQEGPLLTPPEPIEGAELCETGTSNCAQSTPSGVATIYLPHNERVSWSLVKDGYGSTVTPVVTDARFLPRLDRQMWTDEWYAENFSRLSTDYPMTDKGAIMIELFSPFAGATFRLVNATGKRYYFAEDGTLSLAIEATTSLGMGGFVEVPPGTVQIEIGGTAKDCFTFAAWPGDENERIEVPVRAGDTTTALITCSLPQ